MPKFPRTSASPSASASISAISLSTATTSMATALISRHDWRHWAALEAPMCQRGEMDLQLAELGAPARETRREAACLLPDADEDILEKLERRLGRLHARQRIGIEDDHEARMLGRGLGFFHPRTWRRSPTTIRGALKLTGLYRRARQNAASLQIR